MEEVDIVVSHYGDPETTCTAVDSIFEFYPNAVVSVVSSESDIEPLGNKKGIQLFIVPNAKKHGEKLDFFFKWSKKPFVLTVDNDIRLKTGGVIEDMKIRMKSDVYAAGEDCGHENYYIHPKLALWNRELVNSFNLSFLDALVYDPVTDRVIELPTGAYLGYQMLLVHGHGGANLNVLSYAHHLSQKV